MVQNTSKMDSFKELTWDDLQEWAGGRVLSRGQSYQRSHHVQELAQTKSGELIARVRRFYFFSWALNCSSCSRVGREG